jgi:AcrR family transcriptional regulator
MATTVRRTDPKGTDGVALSPAFAAALAEADGVQLQRRVTPADAFGLARQWFLQSRRIDMNALAAELGVSRNTLYRWTGDRERLIADVMWSIAARSIEHGRQRATGRGASRIAQVLDYVVDGVSHAPYMQKFLESEPALAFRLVTSREAGVESRTVAAIAALIHEEEEAGDFRSEVDTETLAYALTRLIEAFVYNDTFTGLEARPDAFRKIVRLLLRQP